MLRLFIAFLFLAFSSFSHSATVTHKYYKLSQPRLAYCSLDINSVCQKKASLLSSANSSVIVSSCQDNSPFVFMTYSTITTSNGITSSSPNAGDIGTVYTKICNDSEQLVLKDCTATCVPDPCAGKKDQTIELEQLCGFSQCPKNSAFDSSGVCKRADGTTVPAYAAYTIPDAGEPASFDGCEMVSLSSPDAISRGYFKPQDSGQSELSTYCPVKFKYTGNKSNNTSTPDGVPASNSSPSSNNKPTLPTGYYYPTDSGCKSGDKTGVNYISTQEYLPVCISSDGCGEGQIRNNSGVCVAYKDATNCPNNAVRDNMGNCPTSPNDGGGSGGSCTISGQTQVNGTCQCPFGQTVQNGSCAATGSGDSNNNGGDSGGSCTISGQTQVNGTCQCPTGQTVKDNKCTSSATTGDDNSNGSYTGSIKCEQAPECEGDVVQCGLVAEQYKAKCETLEAITGVTDDEKSKYDEVGTNSGDSRVKAATDTLNNSFNQVKTALAINSPASCPADISINLLKHSVVLPISQVCPLFVLMRYLLALLVDLACLRILYKSFVGD